MLPLVTFPILLIVLAFPLWISVLAFIDYILPLVLKGRVTLKKKLLFWGLTAGYLFGVGLLAIFSILFSVLNLFDFNKLNTLGSLP
jgi:hypothetical protein